MRLDIENHAQPSYLTKLFVDRTSNVLKIKIGLLGNERRSTVFITVSEVCIHSYWGRRVPLEQSRSDTRSLAYSRQRAP